MSTLTVQNIQGSSSSGNTISVASGHVLQAPGHVIQTKHVSHNAVSVHTSNDFTDWFQLDIIPKSATSIMLIHVSCSYAHGNNYSGLVRLARTISGGSTVAVGGGTNTQSAYTPGTLFNNRETTAYAMHTYATTVTDTLSTTTTTNYKVQTWTGGGTSIYLNRTQNNGNSNYDTSLASTLTIYEIAQ